MLAQSDSFGVRQEAFQEAALPSSVNRFNFPVPSILRKQAARRAVQTLVEISICIREFVSRMVNERKVAVRIRHVFFDLNRG
jgi:hypothetical protein